MKRSGISIALAVLLAILAGSCRSKAPIDTTKFSTEVLADGRHIHNLAPQQEGAAPVRFEPVGKIGELEGRGDEDILYDPVDAARLPNGDTLILEAGGCAVKRFDDRRRFVSSFGGKGLGPGDLTSPYRLGLDLKEGLIYIAEDRRVSRFTLEGRFVGSFKRQVAGVGGSSISQQYRTSGMSLLSDSSVVLPADVSLWGEAGAEALLAVYDATGTVVRSFGTVTRFEDPQMTLNANIIYFAADKSDDGYVAFAHQNRIDKYSRDGKLLFTTDRPLPYKIMNEMKAEVFTSGSMKRAFYWPSVTSVAKGLALDARGRLWVLTFLIQPNRFGGFDNQPDFSRCYRFDVFDSQGILRFSVAPPPVKFSGFSIWGDRMYLVDPGDESCVYEYRIIERD